MAGQTVWSCSLHVDDVGKNLTNASQTFAAAFGLGCRIIRTDLAWKDLQPEMNLWSQRAAQFYMDFFSSMRRQGLAPFVILSGAPDWAKGLHKANQSAFFAAAKTYASRALPLALAGRAASTPPSSPMRVQLWNELNHLPSLWVRDSACGLISALGQAARAQLPTSSQLWINVMSDDPLWQKSVDHWLQPDCARTYIDGIGIDHYPGTWSLGAWDSWAKLDTLLSRVAKPAGVDLWSGRRAAVLETGYSSWSSLLATEQDQARWVNTSLPALFACARAAPASAPLELVNWYQLLDGRPKPHESVPQEAHFGVMRWSTLAPKPAFAALAAQIRRTTCMDLIMA
jgi:hypothetical protein